MKKSNKKYWLIIVVGVCLIFGSIAGCASSSDTVTGTVEQSNLAEEENEVSNDSVMPDSKEPIQEDDRLFLGDEFTIYYSEDDWATSIPAMKILISDIGSGIDTEGLIYENTPFVYVELDIENISDKEMYPDAAFEGFYGDDYALDDTYRDDSIFGTSIAPGRKAKGRYYASCPNLAQLNIIEMSFAGFIIVVKDDTQVDANSDNNFSSEVNSTTAFNLERVNDKYYYNGTGEDAYGLYFYVADDEILFTIYQDGIDLVRMVEAEIVDDSTLHCEIELMGHWDLQFSWDSETSFWVTGEGDGMEEIEGMVGTQFFDESIFANAS